MQMTAKKLRTADEVAVMIQDGANIVVDGSGGGVNDPNEILEAIERRFLSTGSPVDLTVIHPSGMGDHKGAGIDRFAHEAMTKRVIGGHWGWSDQMQKLAVKEKIEAYCLPQGVMSHLFRTIAGGQPGLLSKVGIGTFVDPRMDSGWLNKSAKESFVQHMQIDGEDILYYRAFPVDVAIIRATSADEFGNLTMEHEGLYAETLSVAQAAKNSGGIVVAQVKRIVDHDSIDPRAVKVPGVLVDAIALAPNQPLTIEIDSDPSYWGEAKVPDSGWSTMNLTERKVIARRATYELKENDVINLGFGMPDGVSSVLAEEGLSTHVFLTLEQGHIGGVPAGGANFGLAQNQHAMLDAGYQFDWYDGGGLDVTVLSFAEFDEHGNVNVGKFGGRIPGVGGFINISQGAKRVVFVGTFMAGKQQFGFESGKLLIAKEGKLCKAVSQVEQISFSGQYAVHRGQPVTFVTERAVFVLNQDGVVLTEIAPGVDLEKDILSKMGFRPLIPKPPVIMNSSIFKLEKMGLNLSKLEEVVQ
jgi:propionate CoA-transferase